MATDKNCKYCGGSKIWVCPIMHGKYPCEECPSEAPSTDGTVYDEGSGIQNEEGIKRWYIVNGEFHRIDGPACEHANGDKSWYLNGQRHREDGPAVEWEGGIRKEWWINGTYYDNEKNWEEKVRELKLAA